MKKIFFCSIFLLCIFFPFQVKANEKRDLDVTIEHNNPDGYQVNTLFVITVKDSVTNQPVPDLLCSAKYAIEDHGSLTITTKTDENGQIIQTHSVDEAGQKFIVEVKIDENDDYNSVNISKELFTINNEPVIKLKSKLIDYQVDEFGNTTSYSVALFDEDDKLVKEDIFLYSYGIGYNYIFFEKGKITVDVSNIGSDSIEYYGGSGISNDKPYQVSGDDAISILISKFSIPTALEYGKLYHTELFSSSIFFGRNSIALFFPDGTTKDFPIEFDHHLGEFKLILDLNEEETKQIGNYYFVSPYFEYNNDIILPSKVYIPLSTSVHLTQDQLSMPYKFTTANYAAGDVITFDITLKEPYTLKNIRFFKEDNTDVTDLIHYDNENHSFIMPDYSISAVATFVNVYDYGIIEGNNQVVIKEDTDIIFKGAGNFNLLSKVYINGKELDNLNYTILVDQNSLVLNNEFIQTLQNGTYTLTLEYSDGVKINGSFSINKEIINPNTEDNIVLYWLTFLMSSVLLVASSLSFYFLKKQEKNKRTN